MAPSKPGKRQASKPRKRNQKARAMKRWRLSLKKLAIENNIDPQRQDICDTDYMSGVEELPPSPNDTIIRHKYSDVECADSPFQSSEEDSCELNSNENKDIRVLSESDDDLPSLLIEKDTSVKNTITGNRVIDISYFLNQMQIVYEHPTICTMGKYILQKEIRKGLSFKLFFYCDNCEKNYIVSSSPKEKEEDINNSLAWGALSIGIGYSQAEELFSIMDIPMMCSNKFRKHEEIVGKTWEEHLYLQMKANGEQEKLIATNKGHLKDGIPFITVLGDGGWSKRSYGHGFSSTAGVGVIIGAETNKLLFLGVKNSFCSLCARYKTSRTKIPSHTCYKNYVGPATGMEQSIIVEGFSQSVDQHGLLYLNYIGDGDSSVYARLQEHVSYGRHIIKIECSNHMTRAFSDGLHKLATNTIYALDGRRVLTEVVNGVSRIERLVKGVRTAIKESSSIEDHSQGCKILRQDLLNSIDHVCGKHDNCRPEYCKRKETQETDVTPRLTSSNLLAPMRKLLDRLVRNADRLAYNQTTNQAERYMSLVAKLTGGKRIDFCKRGSYKRRALGAGLAHSSGPSWHCSPWKRLSGRSPGKSFKNMCLKREKVRSSLHKKYLTGKRKKNKRKCAGPNIDYGPEAAQPDIPAEDLETKTQEFLQKILKEVDSEEKCSSLERQTVGQHENALWRESRLNRLTASKFGIVVRRLEHTPCHNIVKNILFKQELNTSAIQYGRLHERSALGKYEEIQDVKTNKCGIFVRPDIYYLGASPDATVGTDGIVEIKCFPSIGNLKFEDAVTERKNICLEKKDGRLSLKRSHIYYYQIQGQLNIAQKSFCDFVAYAENDFLFERIYKNEVFWVEIMLPKLHRFYFECMVPEIIDSRIRRKMRCRDPKYILEAQTARTLKRSAGKMCQ